VLPHLEGRPACTFALVRPDMPNQARRLAVPHLNRLRLTPSLQRAGAPRLPGQRQQQQAAELSSGGAATAALAGLRPWLLLDAPWLLSLWQVACVKPALLVAGKLTSVFSSLEVAASKESASARGAAT